MSLLYPDKIKIIPTLIDSELKGITESQEIITKAYVEDESRLRYTKDGTVIQPNTMIFIPDRKIFQNGVLIRLSLKKGDMIIILKMHGEDVILQEQVRREVILVNRVGAQRKQHLEVIL